MAREGVPLIVIHRQLGQTRTGALLVGLSGRPVSGGIAVTVGGPQLINERQGSRIGAARSRVRRPPWSFASSGRRSTLVRSGVRVVSPGHGRAARVAAIGIVAQYVGKPRDGSSTGYLFVTVWDDVESIQAFAGERWQTAVIAPDEEHLLNDTWIGHYDALEELGSE